MITTSVIYNLCWFWKYFKTATGNEKDDPNTKKCCENNVCCYGYKLICVGEQYSTAYKSCFGEDANVKFISNIASESEYCHRLLERNFKKPVAMAEKKVWRFKKLPNALFVKYGYINAVLITNVT